MATSDRGWLKQFATSVATKLSTVPTVSPRLLIRPRDVRTWETDTSGWAADLAKLPTGRSDQLQIWLDLYSNAGSRRLSYCFKTSQPERAEALARVGIRGIDLARWMDDSSYKVEHGRLIMAKPLAARDYRRLVAEIYHKSGHWSFVGMYLPNKIDSSQTPSVKLINEAARFFEGMFRSVMVYHLGERSHVAYPEADRRKVARHLMRERAPQLANLAKLRDEFTCQVCGLNFSQLYGDLGAGFAEAHHRIPLASPKAKKATVVKDLVTVCSNCHRMLHKLPSTLDGVKRLKKVFSGKWPRLESSKSRRD